MTLSSSGDDLARRRVVTVVLRLVLDLKGELSHGEIIDGASQLKGRFASWEGLLTALRRELATVGKKVEERRGDAEL